MAKHFVLIVVFSLLVPFARAQQAVPEALRSSDPWHLVESHGESLGWALFVREKAASTDSLEAYYDSHGRAQAWRATIDGVLYAEAPTAGAFVVTESLRMAYEVYQQQKHLLEALELLDVIEAHVKQCGKHAACAEKEVSH